MKKAFIATLLTCFLLPVRMASADLIKFNFEDTAPADVGGTPTGVTDTFFTEEAESPNSSVTYTLTGVDLSSVGGGVSETISFDVEYQAFANPGANPVLSVFPGLGAIGVISDPTHPNSDVNRGMVGPAVAGEGIIAQVTNIATSGGLTAFTSVEFSELTALMFGGNTSRASVDDGSVDLLMLEAPAGTGTLVSGFVSGNQITYSQVNQYSALSAISFEVVVVPEPSTYALLCLAAIAFCVARRNQWAKQS